MVEFLLLFFFSYRVKRRMVPGPKAKAKVSDLRLCFRI